MAQPKTRYPQDSHQSFGVSVYCGYKVGTGALLQPKSVCRCKAGGRDTACCDWFLPFALYACSGRLFGLQVLYDCGQSDDDISSGRVSLCRDDGPSTTLNEAFTDFEEAAYDGLSEQVMSTLGKDEGTAEASASLDEAFETSS